MRSVFHAITDGIFIVDRAFTIADVNPRMLGPYDQKGQKYASRFGGSGPSMRNQRGV